jgi:uncharacterized membrane protein
VVIQGIIFGLLAAMCQSLCYLFSRRFAIRPGNNAIGLFALTHACMGVFALALLPFCISASVWNVRAYIVPLLTTVICYMTGQIFLFRAVRFTDASRVAPLLGLKILILSLITVVFFREPMTPLQWAAALLCFAAAMALNYSGGGIPLRGFVTIILVCIGYSLSDLAIVSLTRVLAPDGEFRGILLSTSLAYILCGGVGLVLVLAGDAEARAPQKWKEALPVAVTWFAAMIFLFVSLCMVGAVFGNIVQSIRGPLSIVLGAAIAAIGHEHLETRVGTWTLVRRVAAALIMCLAIALFAREQARAGKAAPPPPPPGQTEGNS